MTVGDERNDSVADAAGRSRSGARRDRPAWLQTLIAVPAAVLPLLPSFTCPVCVAAYGGVLSSLGLGFVLIDRMQRPLIVAFLIVSVAGVAATGIRRGFVPPDTLQLWERSLMIRFGTTLVAAFAAAGFAVGCATTTEGPIATTARMHGPADAVIHISGLS